MNADLLLRHFDRISEAPEAVQRLRRFIMDLAIRGKLVEQDPNDEPALRLLEQIETEKNRIIRKGEQRNQRAVPLDDKNLPFTIPKSWVWTQLSRIGFINPRNNVDDSIEVSFVPMTMIYSEYGRTNKHEIRPWVEVKKGFTHFAEGDVGIAKITPCFENGKSTVFRNLTGGLGVGTTELHIVRPILVVPEYILIFLKSPHFINNGIPIMTGTAGQKRISMEYFAFSPFPLPPLAEQQRIVNKVNELMVLCDELEAAQAKREKRRDRLVAATLHSLNNGHVNDETGTRLSFKDSARFYFNHLPRLTTRPEHIRQLRQTILNLAVRGKLVEQDPEDEPVGALLDRIDRERSFTAKEDRRADIEPLSLLAGEKRWEVPSCWRWRAIADLALFIDYRGKTPTKVDSGVRLLTAKNIRKGYIDLDPEEFVTNVTYKEWMTRGLPSKGDVLFTTEAPMGNAAVVRLEEKFALAQRVICFRLYGGLNPEFFVKQIISPPFQQILDYVATGLTAKGIKTAKLKRLPFAVPPLAEQNRIVAKVDELMAICDELETGLITATTTRGKLLEAVLKETLAG